MAQDIVMPRLSDSMEEGTVLKWMKSVGDEIAVGDELVEIETDKANMVYESDTAGTLIAEAQVRAAELFAQAPAQLDLQLSQRVDDLRLERGGGLRLALHAAVRDAAQLFYRAAEFPAPRRAAAQLAPQAFGVAQALAQFRCELARVVRAVARD